MAFDVRRLYEAVNTIDIEASKDPLGSYYLEGDWRFGSEEASFTLSSVRIAYSLRREGLTAAVLCFGLGIVAKIAEDRLEEDELGTSKSLGEALRK